MIEGIRQFADNVWVVDGPLVRDMGLLFTTRMTVVKLADGSVWVESPVSVPEVVLERIREIGRVRYLVASTQRHLWRLNACHELFPDRAIARESLARLLSWDFDRMIIAHGACVERDAKSYVRERFRWLTR